MTAMATAIKTANEWERLWAPYDEPTYQAVLDLVEPDDVVLEIGAGDLRLAYRLAKQVNSVYALEINQALATNTPLGPRPDNLHLIWADAYQYPYPSGVTVGVLLMRHCQHFQLIADKVVAAGGQRLITNARWGLGVELIDLLAPRPPYDSSHFGWYACWCGATGFVSGPPERLTLKLEAEIHEVVDCPACC